MEVELSAGRFPTAPLSGPPWHLIPAPRRPQRPFAGFISDPGQVKKPRKASQEPTEGQGPVFRDLTCLPHPGQLQGGTHMQFQAPATPLARDPHILSTGEGT